MWAVNQDSETDVSIRPSYQSVETHSTLTIFDYAHEFAKFDCKATAQVETA